MARMEAPVFRLALPSRGPEPNLPSMGARINYRGNAHTPAPRTLSIAV